MTSSTVAGGVWGFVGWGAGTHIPSDIHCPTPCQLFSLEQLAASSPDGTETVFSLQVEVRKQTGKDQKQ